MKIILLFILATINYCATSAQDKALFAKKIFIQNGDTLPYRILLPDNYNPQNKYSLVIFLHGSGERGNDNEKQLTHGAELFLRDSIRKKYPAIVVFPQCSENSYWSNVNIAVDKVSDERTFQFITNSEPTVAMNLLINLIDDL